MLQQKERIPEGVERLYRLTSEPREEVQKTTTTDVLSRRVVKKTEEIEKLAKLLKHRAKGGLVQSELVLLALSVAEESATDRRIRLGRKGDPFFFLLVPARHATGAR